MPIGDIHTHAGRRYQLRVDSSDCPLSRDLAVCSVCWRDIGPADPAAPPMHSLAELLEDDIVPIPSTGSKKAKRILAYKHPEPRIANTLVMHKRAKCRRCGANGHADAPLMYCYYAEDVLDLACPVCQGSAFFRCANESGTYVLVAREYVIALYNNPTYYAVWYAQQYFYLDARTGIWFRDSVQWSEYQRQRSATTPTYQYHETNPIQRHGWPTMTAAYELCFGVELEMEHKRLNDENGCRALSVALGGRDGGLPGVSGQYILARDGSLNLSGVELITSPYTLNYHQTQFGWSDLLETVKGIGRSGKGTESCGMHVHCNRQAISALVLGKMLMFCNEPANKSLIDRIAQRDSTYARKSVKKVIDGKRVTSEKYDCLHITQNTIECRLFRGNLRPERVLKNIEFCHALINYCMAASIVECSNFTDFIAWLGKNRGMYRNLVKFLAPHYAYKLTQESKIEDL
jgi:hypothetical protein